jgi:hypothetical protein
VSRRELWAQDELALETARFEAAVSLGDLVEGDPIGDMRPDGASCQETEQPLQVLSRRKMRNHMEENRLSKPKRTAEKAAKRQRKAGGHQPSSDENTPRQAKQIKREAVKETDRQTQQTTPELAKGLPSDSNNGSYQERGNAENSIVTAAEVFRSPTGEFLCIFALAEPGLVALNKLALRLVALKNDGLIQDWHVRGYQDRKTREKVIIGFDTEVDAAIAKSRCS